MKKIPNINNHIFKQPGIPWSEASYSDDAQAVFDLMTGLDDSKKDIYAAFIDAQVTNGNWALLDVFQFYGMTTESDALTDWKGNANATNINSVPFTSNSHFAPDGATKYIQSGFDPSVLLGNYVEDDAFAGCYNLTNNNVGTNNRMMLGTNDGADQFWIIQEPTSTRIQFKVNATVGGLYASDSNFSNQSLYLAVRDAAFNQELYKNGSSVQTSAGASSGLAESEFYVGAYNNNGTPAFHYDCELCCFVAGAHIGFDHSSFSTDLTTMLTGLGII